MLRGKDSPSEEMELCDWIEGQSLPGLKTVGWSPSSGDAPESGDERSISSLQVKSMLTSATPLRDSCFFLCVFMCLLR